MSDDCKESHKLTIRTISIIRRSGPAITDPEPSQHWLSGDGGKHVSPGLLLAPYAVEPQSRYRARWGQLRRTSHSMSLHPRGTLRNYPNISFRLGCRAFVVFHKCLFLCCIVKGSDTLPHSSKGSKCLFIYFKGLNF